MVLTKVKKQMHATRAAIASIVMANVAKGAYYGALFWEVVKRVWDEGDGGDWWI